MNLKNSTSKNIKKVNVAAYSRQQIIIAIFVALLTVFGAKIYADYRVTNELDYNKIDKDFTVN